MAAGKSLGSRADHPVLQMLTGAGCEYRSQAADWTVGRRELRATGKDFGQHLFPRFPRASVGVTHDPPGDLSESWWRGPDDMDPTSALWPQIVANDLVTAVRAETLELGVEMDRVGDSVCPAFVQVGLVGRAGWAVIAAGRRVTSRGLPRGRIGGPCSPTCVPEPRGEVARLSGCMRVLVLPVGGFQHRLWFSPVGCVPDRAVAPC